MQRSGAVVAAVSLVAERTESGVLERLVRVAGELVEAPYAAALLIGPDRTPSGFAHVSGSPSPVADLHSAPRPVGLIGAVADGETLRLDDLSGTEWGGLPTLGPASPQAEMRSLLATPIREDGDVLGVLYLTRCQEQPAFTDADELTLRALAQQAAAAVSRLRHQRSAHSLAEQLGSEVDGSGHTVEVSLVVRRLLAAAREALGFELAYISRIVGDRQFLAHVDREPGAWLSLEEGLSAPTAEGYCAAMLSGRVPHAVPDVVSNPVLAVLPATAALGIGSYCGVPILLPDGIVHGALCGIDSQRGLAPTDVQLETLKVIAGLIGGHLEKLHEIEAERQEEADAFMPLLTAHHRTVHLQPIVDLRLGRPVGFEALARFKDDAGVPRRPDQVFAEANRLGLGLQLEQSAARAALRHVGQLPTDTYLSVNLSPAALVAPATHDLLMETVSHAADRVVLELTEHERVPDYGLLLDTLAGLRERGLRLAIDDTGSGFSSLQHVTRMNPDIVKLDIAFVRDVHLDPSRRAVARALTAFAQDMGADLVAEGIETAEELDELVRIGAPFGQGYHLGRPAPAGSVLTKAAPYARRTVA